MKKQVVISTLKLYQKKLFIKERGIGMRKIGILTFHDGFNFGAFMQVFSLQQALQGLGHQVEIINYKSMYHWIREYIHIIKKNNTPIDNIKKILKFKTLQNNSLRMGNFSFEIKNINKSYDIVFFGSDEIWNVKNGFFGHNYIYFGKSFPKTIKKIAYAPSCGSTTIDAVELIGLKEELLNFTSIGVRDYNTYNIVKQLTGESPAIVPDPTFLIDHSQHIKFPKSKNYILVYSDKLPVMEIERIKKFAISHHKKLISVGFHQDWCDENYISIDPFEWLGYIHNADYIFTTMFHGTIFSILFNKQFSLLMDPYRTNKFGYILEYFELDKEQLNGNREINYQSINLKIKEFRKNGLLFIKNSIDHC